MSSCLENAAGAEIQPSPALNTVNFAAGTGDDAASGVHAPASTLTPPLNSAEPVPVSVYQPESVVVSAPVPGMTAAEAVNQFAAAAVNQFEAVAAVNEQSNGNGSNGSALKRKRGRPRKYVPASDGSVVAASPLSAIPAQLQSGGSVGDGGVEVGQGVSGKRGRGRPVGSRGKPKASSVFPFNVSPTVSGKSAYI